MIGAVRRRSGFGDGAVDLVADVDKDSRIELVGSTFRNLAALPHRSSIIGGVLLELNRRADLYADRLNVSALPACDAVKHSLGSRVRGSDVSNERRSGIRAGEGSGVTSDFERNWIAFHKVYFTTSRRSEFMGVGVLFASLVIYGLEGTLLNY